MDFAKAVRRILMVVVVIGASSVWGNTFRERSIHRWGKNREWRRERKGNIEKKITKVLTRRQTEYRHKTYELQLQRHSPTWKEQKTEEKG
jgi:hypothetical protein